MRGLTLSTLTVIAAATMALNACSGDMATAPDSSALAAAKGGNGGGKGKGGKPGPTPQPADQIAYSEKAADGTTDIYVMNADGTGVTRLTSNGYDYSPHWTKDHAHIVFISDRDGIGHVYIMNADGTNQLRLTDTNYRDADPDPSPDGTQIAFQRNGAGVSGIYVMNVDGTNAHKITTEGDELQPAWSPDGQHIAFAAYGGYAYTSIFMVTPDGSNLSLVATCGYSCFRPTFSPDGTRVAYLTTFDNGGINWVSLDKQSFAVIATNLGALLPNAPAWSPDGSRIAFSGKNPVTGNEDLYSASSVDGSNVTQLTFTSGLDAFPSWR